MQNEGQRKTGFLFVALGIVCIILSFWFMARLSQKTGGFDSYTITAMGEYFILIIVESVVSIILGLSILANGKEKYKVMIIGMTVMLVGIGLFFLSLFGLGFACQAIGAILFVMGLITKKG